MKWNVLLELELKCSLLLMVAFLVILLMRRFSSAQRYFVLMLAVCGGLLIPSAHFLLPHWETKMLPPAPMETEPAPQASGPAPVVAFSEPTVTVPALTVTPTITSVERVETISPTVEPELSTPTKEVASEEEPPSILLHQIIGFVWLGGAALILLSLVFGWFSVWRIVRRASEAQGVWSETRERVRGRLTISRKVALLECSSRWAPMAFGLFRPTIVLPVDGRAWPEQKRSAVLVHELAHVKRNDCLLHSVCTIALALHWFNPLFWIAARQLRLEREHACDDYVLTNGAPPADYADQLLEVARMQSGRVPLLSAAITMARKNALEGRLLAILDGGRRRGAFGLGAVCLALLLTVGIALPLASATGAKAQTMTDDVVAVVGDEVSENANVPPANLVEVIDAAVEPSEKAVEALVEFEGVPPESRTEISAKEPEVTVPESSSSDALPDTEFVSESPNFWLTSSPPSLFLDHVSVPIIDSGESGVADVSEMTAAPFLGEWVELTDDPSTALHFLVEQNGQALLEGGDVRTRMQWKLNYDELLLTTSEGVRTADISPEGLLIYRKGGRTMMTFRRPGSTAELPEKLTDAVNIPSAKEQLESRLTAAASISSSASKNAALSEIALDAAKFGCADQMKRAVNGISMSGIRNETADKCVDLLLELGLVKEATELAKGISTSGTRDDALVRIARQQTVVREDDVLESRAVPRPTAEMKSQLESRLKVAESILLIQERDAALMGVAADAARMGNVSLALKAVRVMSVISSKTEAAEQCADLFILQGMSEEAVQMADQIALINRKNEVLARIAQGRSAVIGSGGVSGSIGGQPRYERRMSTERQAEYTRQLEARMTIAEQIALPSDRDEILTGIAVDAARLGVIETALKALDKITFVSTRDAAAVRCADEFILQGLTAEAGRVAEKITFYNTKKEVIDKIARGSSPLTGGSSRATPENGWTIHYSSEDPPSPEQAEAMQKQIEAMQKQMETMMKSGVMQDQMGAMEKQMESMSQQMESMVNSMGTP